MNKIAAVTGSTGMVGKRIVTLLLEKGFRVRVLTRNKTVSNSHLEIVYGDIKDKISVEKLLEGVDCLFHCAAELNDESKMWDTNVEGTRLLLEAATKLPLSYICHMSSVGVIGKISGFVANEQTPCSPLNTYEKTKLEAEQLAMSLNTKAKIIVLRPTNVVDKNKNGLKGLSLLKVFLKGGENAHIVHASDVAAAAVYFIDHSSQKSPDCFIVSCDNEKLNTIAGSFAVCQAIKSNTSLENVTPLPHLSWRLTYFARRILKGPCNRSDIIYSSQKLISTGFQFPLGFTGAIKDICENN